MQVGVITVDGRVVGTITQDQGAGADPVVPNLDGYEPEGRAEDPTPGGSPGVHHGGGPHGPHQGGGHHDTGAAPKGEKYAPSNSGSPFRQGSAETDQALVDAAKAHNFDPNLFRATASIESGMIPSSNANRPTQYKGLFQMGTRGADSEWARFGNGGNPYSARDNAMGAARAWDANRNLFHKHYGRDPTDTELYLMHQQGLGFYTRGAMTNIGGNPYPGMHGPQTHESFEAGWGRELARRKAGFAARDNPKPTPAGAKPFDPSTDVP